MKTPKQILDETLDLTNKLAKFSKELEDQIESGAEMLAVRKLQERINDVEIAVGVNRGIFEQRLNNKET